MAQDRMCCRAPVIAVIKLASHKLRGIFDHLTITYREELCSKEFLSQWLLTTAICIAQCSLHSSVGTAPRYGLDGAGIEFLWGDVLRTWGPTSLLYKRHRISFPGSSLWLMALKAHPHLSPRLYEELSHTCIPFWTFMNSSMIIIFILVHFSCTPSLLGAQAWR